MEFPAVGGTPPSLMKFLWRGKLQAKYKPAGDQPSFAKATDGTLNKLPIKFPHGIHAKK
jgi:hypothetical protein